jgi:hypothetical protein
MIIPLTFLNINLNKNNTLINKLYIKNILLTFMLKQIKIKSPVL